MAYSQQVLKEFPYVEDGMLSRRTMIHFNIALLFPMAGGFYFFGLAMLRTAILCVVFSILTEVVMNKLMKKESTLGDLTALATGLVIAINMRPGIGWYPLLLACILGVAVGKTIFGGKGFNPVNPAVVGRLLPVAGFPALWATAIRPTIPNLMEFAGLTYWEATQYVFVRDVRQLPFYNKVAEAQPAFANYSFSSTVNTHYDVLSGTTYLETVKNWYKSGVMPSGVHMPTDFFDHWTLFYGNMPGTLGETGKWLLLLGFLYLVITKVISPLIPLSIWAMTYIFGWVFAATRLGPAGFGPLGFFQGDGLVWLLSGGVILGSVYMETDPVTSPRTFKGKMVFSFIFVAIVTAIRLVFSFPEGVSFALLTSTLLLPFIDKLFDREHKHAKIIHNVFVTVSAIITVTLLSAYIYNRFTGASPYEKIVRSMSPELANTHIQEREVNGEIHRVIFNPNNEEVGHIFIHNATGYNELDISVAVIVKKGSDEIFAIEATDVSTQTEGIGQRVAEAEFTDQFVGKTLAELPTSPSDWSEKGFDMVTGATFSSEAFLSATRSALEFNQLIDSAENN